MMQFIQRICELPTFAWIFVLHLRYLWYALAILAILSILWLRQAISIPFSLSNLWRSFICFLDKGLEQLLQINVSLIDFLASLVIIISDGIYSKFFFLILIIFGMATHYFILDRFVLVALFSSRDHHRIRLIYFLFCFFVYIRLSFHMLILVKRSELISIRIRRLFVVLTWLESII